MCIVIAHLHEHGQVQICGKVAVLVSQVVETLTESVRYHSLNSGTHLHEQSVVFVVLNYALALDVFE
jgi:hypothetical protein